MPEVAPGGGRGGPGSPRLGSIRPAGGAPPGPSGRRGPAQSSAAESVCGRFWPLSNLQSTAGAGSVADRAEVPAALCRRHSRGWTALPATAARRSAGMLPGGP